MQLTFTPDEVLELRQILGSELVELRSELHHTDRGVWRRELHAREERLHALIERVDALLEESAPAMA